MPSRKKFSHSPARKKALRRAAEAEKRRRATGLPQIGRTRLMYGQAQAMAHTMQHWLDEEQPET